MSNDDTITQKQANRLYAIALETGYTRPGVKRLLKAHEYEEAENIIEEDYEKLCEMAEEESLAFSYNRDPDTPDMFSEDNPDY